MGLSEELLVVCIDWNVGLVLIIRGFRVESLFLMGLMLRRFLCFGIFAHLDGCFRLLIVLFEV